MYPRSYRRVAALPVPTLLHLVDPLSPPATCLYVHGPTDSRARSPGVLTSGSFLLGGILPFLGSSITWLFFHVLSGDQMIIKAIRPL